MNMICFHVVHYELAIVISKESNVQNERSFWCTLLNLICQISPYFKALFLLGSVDGYFPTGFSQKLQKNKWKIREGSLQAIRDFGAQTAATC